MAQAQAAVTAAQTKVTAAQNAVTTAQAAVTAAQANVTRCETAVRTARTTSQRVLAQRNLVGARSALQRAQQTLVGAQATLQKAQQELTAAQAALQKAQAAAAAAPAVVLPAPTLQILEMPRLVRTLHVGINYKKTQYELYGCINDATNMMSQLKTFFPTMGESRLITDDTVVKPTKANILSALSWLVADIQPGQNVLFQFSGHGGQVRDTNGDEVEGYDECIYPVNGTQMEVITDDELKAVLAAKIPAGSKCFVILDCCHSGSAVDLRYLWQAPAVGSLTYTEDAKQAKTTGDVLFLSGCRDTEYAMDTVAKDSRPCGAMTMALLDVWRSYGPGIKLKYLLWDVRQYLKTNGYTQIPQLSTGTFMDMNAVWNLGA